jgi:hypothetical protein
MNYEMKKSLPLFFLTIISMVIASCQGQKPYGDIVAYDYDVYQHELQLKYHTKGRGNIHTYSLAKYEYDQYNWIYTNRLHGKIEADCLVFTYRHLNIYLQTFKVKVSPNTK